MQPFDQHKGQLPMLGDSDYASSAGVENAIKDSAQRAAEADASLGVSTRIQLEYFDRFLSRVFSDGEDSEWILKGGTGMLARVPSARSTLDIDLYRQGFNLVQALDDLVRLAAVDLRDHFRFVYVDHVASIGANTQPDTEGYRVRFHVFVGLAARGSIQVDLALGANMVGEVATIRPATKLSLPRLVSNSYRLYPIEDQIADKVCATLAEYNGRTSTREKDLVDLVVMATTQTIDGSSLQAALSSELYRRQMGPIDRFAIPPTWGAGYAKLSRSVPYCARYRTVGSASNLISELVDPVLAGNSLGKTWSKEDLSWV